jgi:hypothetical protein
MLGALAAVACDDDGEPSPTATAVATNTAVAASGDDAGFRAFAGDIAAAVEAGDAAFFRERMQTVPVDCSTDPNVGQIGGPVCPTPDAMYDGFQTGAWRSEGAIVPADGAAEAFQRLFDEQLPGESDVYGSGEAQLYALNVESGAYQAAITALAPRPPDFAGEGPLRAVLSTSWVFEDGEWRMALLIIAYVLAEDFLEPNPEAGYDAWERYSL